MMDDFFTTEELSKPFKLSSELLPTKTDCLLYVVSRTHFKNNLYNQTHDKIVLELARKVRSME